MTYVLHYVSADGPEADAKWSVYSERYPSLAESDGDPIEGSQRWHSRHATEAEAQAEATRLQTAADHRAAAKVVYYQPIVTQILRADGRWDIEVDWSGSQSDYSEEDHAPMTEEEWEAASDDMDLWVRTHSQKFIINPRKDGL